MEETENDITKEGREGERERGGVRDVEGDRHALEETENDITREGRDSVRERKRETKRERDKEREVE